MYIIRIENDNEDDDNCVQFKSSKEFCETQEDLKEQQNLMLVLLII